MAALRLASVIKWLRETLGNSDSAEEITSKTTVGATAEFTKIPELPERILWTYSRLWQFERWLRQMAYVELRALEGNDWARDLKRFEMSLRADRRLHHMPTPEDDPLSYVSFSSLLRLISDNWKLFSTYLPPRTIWDARIEEVAQIRHRVAHFRKGHFDDYNRMLQLLRDTDKGFWTFCTSYNDPSPILPPTRDPVTDKFLEFDPFPYCEVSKGKWARVGHADPAVVFGLTIEVLRRPWASREESIAGKSGYFFDVRITARENRTFDIKRFLDGTRNDHSSLVHICLDESADSIRITIPSLLGVDRIVEIVENMVDVTRHTIRPGQFVDFEHSSIQELSEQWPEFVLGPENPLTFLSPDMPCSYFNV